MEQKKAEIIDTTQMGMLFKSEFSDKQLEAYLNLGKIKPSERPDNPPQILWVDDCTIATFGNFSASTGKAKSKKTFNISAMVAAALKNDKVLNYRACLPPGKIRYCISTRSRAVTIVIMYSQEFSVLPDCRQARTATVSLSSDSVSTLPLCVSALSTMLFVRVRDTDL